MYKFPHAAFSDDSAMDALRLFISSGHETATGMEVPPPESEFKRTIRQWIHTIMVRCTGRASWYRATGACMGGPCQQAGVGRMEMMPALVTWRPTWAVHSG